MRWLFWTPLAVLAVGAGLFGLRLGYAALTLSETDVINHYAARYVAEAPGGAPSDCVAFPGPARSGIWLVVACGQPCAPGRQEYHVNRLGRFVHGGDMACPQAALGRAIT